MQTNQPHPLILTLKLDQESQAFFDDQRARYFPPDRNFLQAHLTLFHQLPDEPATIACLQGLAVAPFQLQIAGLINLGRGVAYRLESAQLLQVHTVLAAQFAPSLTPQDKQPLRPHITIQNKTSPEEARSLLITLSETFQPFTVAAAGFDLWTYLGGPWQHRQFFPFS